MQFDLDHIFCYHAPEGDDLERYQKIREAGKAFAEVILANTPECEDQTCAINMIRDTVMVSNASVALKGRLFPVRYTPSPESLPERFRKRG